MFRISHKETGAVTAQVESMALFMNRRIYLFLAVSKESYQDSAKRGIRNEPRNTGKFWRHPAVRQCIIRQGEAWKTQRRGVLVSTDRQTTG